MESLGLDEIRDSYFGDGRLMRGEGPEAYSEEVERLRWKEITDAHDKSMGGPRAGVSMFLALVDDECHELIPVCTLLYTTRLCLPRVY